MMAAKVFAPTMNDQDIVAEVPENIAVFALPLPQSVQMLSAVVHDTSLPDKVRQGAARLLIPHLQVELARLRLNQVCLDRFATAASPLPN